MVGGEETMYSTPLSRNRDTSGLIIRIFRTMDLEHLNIFLQIVERGSLAATARAAGLSSTTVSERLAALEEHYGTRLLNRTTRAIHLTEAGRALVEGAPRLLAEEKELRSRIRLGVDSLAGPIRVSAPVDLGRQRVAPLLDAFLVEHPDVSGELLLSDAYVNVLAESIDIAVRFGALPNSSLRVRHVGEHRRIVCAAPSYVKAYGKPKSPAGLDAHNCLRMRFGGMLDDEWHFVENGKPLTVRVSGDRIANDGALVRRWCLDGRGVAFKSSCDVGEDIDAGRLVELLPDYASGPMKLQLVFPPGRSHPRRVQAFADTLVASLLPSH